MIDFTKTIDWSTHRGRKSGLDTGVMMALPSERLDAATRRIRAAIAKRHHKNAQRLKHWTGGRA